MVKKKCEMGQDLGRGTPFTSRGAVDEFADEIAATLGFRVKLARALVLQRSIVLYKEMSPVSRQ